VPMDVKRAVRATLTILIWTAAAGAQAKKPTPASPSTALLFVSNEISRDVTVVRLSDLSVVATIPVSSQPSLLASAHAAFNQRPIAGVYTSPSAIPFQPCRAAAMRSA
jgi:hypothetical protein